MYMYSCLKPLFLHESAKKKREPVFWNLQTASISVLKHNKNNKILFCRKSTSQSGVKIYNSKYT